MNVLLSRADLTAVTSGGATEDDRGAAIRARFDALGMSDREWHAQTGIDRKTLNRAMENRPGTRSSTYDAIEANLDKLEKLQQLARGESVAVVRQPEQPNVIRFVVEGVYGAKALVVEGPVENIGELEAAVDRIMRRLQTGGSDPSAG